jgi:hypothetical protein
MTSALRWAGYFAIIVGLIIAIYLISSLKVIDINALELIAEESPHPYRWAYAFFVLAVTTPIGLLSVAASQFLESKSEDFTYNASERRKAIRES